MTHELGDQEMAKEYERSEYPKWLFDEAESIDDMICLLKCCAAELKELRDRGGFEFINNGDCYISFRTQDPLLAEDFGFQEDCCEDCEDANGKGI
jgi:hypothetical protein